MSLRIVRRPLVLRHLAGHFHYIGLDNVDAALRFIDDVERAANLIAEYPTVGAEWQSTDPRLAGIRHTLVSRRFRRYVIFYRFDPEQVELLAVLHGSRDLRAALGDLLAE